mmetsp:Transcript_155064/g.289285  ORF Transcript_155064/g.289285 Transcript_155064/m.289285 type:complete len:153 (-) Transcript_155064:359-817(-)
MSSVMSSRSTFVAVGERGAAPLGIRSIESLVKTWLKSLNCRGRGGSGGGSPLADGGRDNLRLCAEGGLSLNGPPVAILTKGDCGRELEREGGPESRPLLRILAMTIEFGDRDRSCDAIRGELSLREAGRGGGDRDRLPSKREGLSERLLSSR